MLATPLQEADDAGPEACAQLAAKLKPALGDSSAVLSGSLPALARLLGQDPAPQELSANDARARFLTAVLRFIAAFAHQNQPLMVFLDDLQWADPASLALLQGVLEAQVPFEGKRLPSRLRFVHDRMQQAAYASIPAADRSALHLEIGRRLYDHAVEHGGDELDAVSHFNQALVLLQPQERPLVANLNEAAAIRAKAAAAFEPAAAFSRLAVLLMPGAALAWRQDAALARRRYRLLAEISPLAGAMEEGLNTIDDALAVESEPSERAEFQLLRINQFTLAARYADAIAAGQASLLELNAALSKLPAADAEAAEATTQAIARLPQSARMAQGSAELPLRVSLAMGPPCYRSNPLLWQQVVHTELALMLRAGWAPAATYTLPAYAGLTAPWTATGVAVARHAEHASVIEQALPDESVFEERCQSNGNAQVLCIYRLMRADTLLLQNQTDAAAAALAKAKPDLALVATQDLLPAAQAQVVEALLLARKPDRSTAVSERLRHLQDWLPMSPRLRAWPLTSNT